MDIKSEIEIKMEELVPENDFSQDYQIFPHIEAMIPFPERIKKELNENSSFIKSEPRESNLEFVFNEEKLKNNVIKSENSPMKKFDVYHKFMSLKNVSSLQNKVNEKGFKAHFESDEEEYFAQLLTSKFPLLLLKKLSYKELKTLIGNCGKGESDSKAKSCLRRSRRRRGSSAMQNQSMKKNSPENVCCKYCNFSFSRKEELKNHLKICKRKFKCDHCKYECSQKSNLNSHLLVHSNLKLFKCSECSYECNHKGLLKIHLLNHENIKLFKCSECSYGSNDKGHFKRHMMKHLDTKLFKCGECDYECNRKDNMKVHMKARHTKVRLFKCCECSYRSSYKENLKRHMRNHRDTKLFKCSRCSYECNHKGLLKIHLLNHGNIKLFKCSKCSYECNRKHHLK
ncbi:UNVERIFIED_CONTAM: hypothetical protein RMT77_002288 [Armadillidium vulgare]